MEAFGRFSLTKRLGAGGMGEVFLARSDADSAPIVLKRILPHLIENPRFLRLFLDETRIASRLMHPNIVRIHELGEANGTWFVAMEHVPGKDLRELMKRSREQESDIPISVVLKIGVEVAKGLHYAHEATDAQGRSLKIVHRDVSPHNVLVSKRGEVKLIDFGVAKAANKSVHTATGILKGKFPYMAPEQASAKAVDARTDVFALGIVLWEAICGRYLFRGKSDAATIKMVRAAEVAPPSDWRPDAPQGLDRVLLKALKKEPQERYPTAQAFQEALEGVLAGLPPPNLAAWFKEFEDVGIPGLDDESGASLDEPGTDDAQDAKTVPEAAPLGKQTEAPVHTRADRSRGSSSGVRPAASTAEAARKILSQLTGTPTNLGKQATSFVGRVAELADLHQLFRQGSRLVTLLGPGGTGKTRLSMQFAEQLVSYFRTVDSSGRRRGGVWFCDLTEAADVDGLCSAMASAMGVPLAPGDAVQQLGHALVARGEVLVVLDNFEQLVGYVGETVERWMRTAPEARFVATSRELLRVPNETVFEVPPLRMPSGPDDVRSSEAVQLFVERARTARPGFEPAPGDDTSFAEIVRQLDGMPLAIELAAARMAVLSPQQLLQRLPRRFDLLVGSRGAKEHQATLRDTIDWSWQSLSKAEAAALAQLSVFRGGFTTEAADVVVDLSRTGEVTSPLEALMLLRAKSLVRAYFPRGDEGQTRFGLYETIREYAKEKLAGTSAEAGAARRHTLYSLEIGAALADGAEGSKAQLDALDLERDNLLAVYQRALEAQGPSNDALQAVLALDPLLTLRGPFKQHLVMLDSSLAKLAPESRRRSAGLEARGRARQARGRIPDAEQDFEAALELARAAKDVALEGRLLLYLGIVERLKGQRGNAQKRFARALLLLRSFGDRRMEGRALSNYAVLLHELGQENEALDAYNEALEIHREVKDRRYEGVTLANLGVQQQALGLLKQARANYQAALTIHRELGNRRSEGISHINLGDLSRDLGQPGQALAHYESALKLLREAGARRFEGIALVSLASLRQETVDYTGARSAYRDGIVVLREVNEKKYEGLGRAGQAAIDALEGHLPEARQEMQEATRLMTEAGDASFLDALDVYRAHLELAQAYRERDGDAAPDLSRVERRVKHASRSAPPDAEHPAGVPSPADRSEHVRAALRSLRAAQERLAAE